MPRCGTSSSSSGSHCSSGRWKGRLSRPAPSVAGGRKRYRTATSGGLRGQPTSATGRCRTVTIPRCTGPPPGRHGTRPEAPVRTAAGRRGPPPGARRRPAWGGELLSGGQRDRAGRATGGTGGPTDQGQRRLGDRLLVGGSRQGLLLLGGDGGGLGRGDQRTDADAVAAQPQADLGQQVGEFDVEGVADRGEQLGGGLLLPPLDLREVAQAHPGGTGDVAQRPPLAQSVATQGRPELGAQQRHRRLLSYLCGSGGTRGGRRALTVRGATDAHRPEPGASALGVTPGAGRLFRNPPRRPELATGGENGVLPRAWGRVVPAQAAESVRGPDGPAERRAAAARAARALVRRS